MRLIVAFLMAFGFYGLSFGQSDSAATIPDTTGMTGEEPTLSCYMVDESTFLCTVDEPAEGSEKWNESESTSPETESESDVLNESENNADIEGREEDVIQQEEYPSQPERESDEGVMPQDESENQNQDQSDESNQEIKTY